MSKSEILSRFDQLNVWKRGDQRAPHKPLLVLLALGRMEQGLPRMGAFEEFGPRLKRLLQDFGPSRRAYHPEYPFWRLESDGVWEISSDSELSFNVDPSEKALLESGAQGGFTPEIQEALEDDPRLRYELAEQFLKAHFPESYWEDLLSAVGLDRYRVSRRLERDPAFRVNVLTAYAHSCSFCGLDLRIGESILGLEAAHIKWKQAGGPDVVRNGLCLCSFHHRAFDLGAVGLDEELKIRVSCHVHGSDQHRKLFLQIHGLEFRRPSREEWLPSEEFRRWHLREVFRRPAVS